jgi:hypothetical protein
MTVGEVVRLMQDMPVIETDSEKNNAKEAQICDEKSVSVLNRTVMSKT